VLSYPFNRNELSQCIKTIYIDGIHTDATIGQQIFSLKQCPKSCPIENQRSILIQNEIPHDFINGQILSGARGRLCILHHPPKIVIYKRKTHVQDLSIIQCQINQLDTGRQIQIIFRIQRIQKLIWYRSLNRIKSSIQGINQSFQQCTQCRCFVTNQLIDLTFNRPSH